MPKSEIKNYHLLDGVDKNLVSIVTLASTCIPITVIEGKRTIERQKDLLKKRRTKTLSSLHITGEAVDIMPSCYEGWGDLDDGKKVINIAKELGHFYRLSGAMFMAAVCLKFVKFYLRWGGDWDGDLKFKDQKFDDLVHYEIREKNYERFN